MTRAIDANIMKFDHVCNAILILGTDNLIKFRIHT